MSCHGCCGGYMSCHGCCGGYVSCHGCCGGAAPAPAPAPAPAKEAAPKKAEATTPAPATIVVNLPTEARLTVDDAATSSTSNRRVFVSPELAPGREYHYTLKAEWVRDGKPVIVTRKVAVTAGNETNISLAAETAEGVASR
jgi:uncharacterized protein (TIGR03000 family)